MKSIFSGRPRADLQVFGAAADAECLRAMSSGKVLLGGRRCGWLGAKLSATPDEIDVQTPFGNYAWRQVDRPPIVRANVMGWEFGNPDAGDAQYMLFHTLHWNVGKVERKLQGLGYEIRSRTYPPTRRYRPRV